MQARALAHERGGAPLSALHARVPGCPRTLAIAARSAIVCFGLNFMPSSTSCMSSRPWRTSLRKTWPRSLVSWCPGTRLVPPTSRLLFWWLGGNGGEGRGGRGEQGHARGTRLRDCPRTRVGNGALAVRARVQARCGAGRAHARVALPRFPTPLPRPTRPLSKAVALAPPERAHACARRRPRAAARKRTRACPALGTGNEICTTEPSDGSANTRHWNPSAYLKSHAL